MATFLHPVGPEPPAVYWIRRGAAALVVVVLLASVAWFAFGSDGSAPAPEPAASPSAQATAAAASPSPSPTSTEPLECSDASILVTASTDQRRYDLGSSPTLTLAIENIGTSACIRDVGPRANELKITSGGYHVWSSDDCNASDTSTMTLLQPGDKVATSIAWNGRLSSKECPADPAKAKPGNYEVTARNGKVSSEKARFQLTRA